MKKNIGTNLLSSRNSSCLHHVFCMNTRQHLQDVESQYMCECWCTDSAVCAELLLLLLQVLIHCHQSPQLLQQAVQQNKTFLDRLCHQSKTTGFTPVTACMRMSKTAQVSMSTMASVSKGRALGLIPALQTDLDFWIAACIYPTQPWKYPFRNIPWFHWH